MAGRNVQIHGFGSQGFAYSDQNSFLTMKTREGSFAFTESGLNASTNITDKFRFGAQAYAGNIGELGKVAKIEAVTQNNVANAVTTQTEATRTHLEELVSMVGPQRS